MVMANEREKDIGRMFRERKPIDEALNAAAREAVKQHRQQGQPLVVYRNGQTVLISPDEADQERANKR
jgi:hypothetical protein